MNKLTVKESEDLKRLEETAEHGLKQWMATSLALAEIGNRKLYRLTHSSFNEYLEARWGIKKSYGYQLIASGEVASELSAIADIPTEAAARAISKVPPQQREKVVSEIVAEGKPITAAEVVNHTPQPPKPPAKPAAKKTTRMPEKAILDETGWAIPTQLIPLWRSAGEVQEMLTALSHIKGAVRRAQDEKKQLYLKVSFGSALAALESAWTELKVAKPYAVCTECQGQLPENCAFCKGVGFISEFHWKTCVPAEVKELRMRARAAK